MCGEEWMQPMQPQVKLGNIDVCLNGNYSGGACSFASPPNHGCFNFNSVSSYNHVSLFLGRWTGWNHQSERRLRFTLSWLLSRNFSQWRPSIGKKDNRVVVSEHLQPIIVISGWAVFSIGWLDYKSINGRWSALRCMFPLTQHVAREPSKDSPTQSATGQWSLYEDRPNKPGWISTTENPGMSCIWEVDNINVIHMLWLCIWFPSLRLESARRSINASQVSHWLA